MSTGEGGFHEVHPGRLHHGYAFEKAGPSALPRRVGRAVIMSPDEAALIRLWKEKRGEVEPMDLSDNLVVQLGIVTEALNRSWYERDTGHSVTDSQRWSSIQ
jgi:hypothetical protein